MSAPALAGGSRLPDVPEYLKRRSIRVAIRVLYVLFSSVVFIAIAPFILVVYLGVALVLLTMLPYTLVRDRRRSAALRERLGPSGRVLSVAALEGHLAEGRGTLIVDEDGECGAHLWWTPERILGLGPQPACCLPITDGEAWATQEFVDWCRATCLDPTRGTALVVDVSAGRARRLVHGLQARPTACEVVCLLDSFAAKRPAPRMSADDQRDVSS